MKTTRTLLIISIVVAAVAIATPHLIAQAAQSSSGSKVAVCRLVEAFKNYHKARDMSEKINRELDSIRQKGQAANEEFGKIADELKGLKPGSAAYESRATKAQRMRLQLDADIKLQKFVIGRKHREGTMKMYAEIRHSVAKIAKQRGFDIVLLGDEGQLAAENESQMLNELRSRKVLYANPAVDITTDVLRDLNRAYKAGGNK